MACLPSLETQLSCSEKPHVIALLFFVLFPGSGFSRISEINDSPRISGSLCCFFENRTTPDSLTAENPAFQGASQPAAVPCRRPPAKASRRLPLRAAARSAAQSKGGPVFSSPFSRSVFWSSFCSPQRLSFSKRFCVAWFLGC